MYRRCSLLLCLYISIVNVSTAQILLIMDQQTNEKIAFATISSQQKNEFAITDEQGRAAITAFKGASDIEIRALSYKTTSFSYDNLFSAGFKIYLEKSGLKLDEIIVSASRWRQGSGNVPAKIISISPEDIVLQNPQTAADLLNISGKVYIQKSQQGGGSPMIRGFATNRLLYSVDGIRMNTAIFRGGNIQNIINLDPFTIEHTEVLFGPGSVIYGSDAIGGVMSFQTLTPKFSTSEKLQVSGKANLRYSSANKEKTAHIDFNLGGKQWAYVASFSHWTYDHLRQGRYGSEDYIKDYYVDRIDSIDIVITQADPLLQIPSAYTQWNTLHKIRFKPNSHWDINYAYHLSQTSSYGRYDRHNRVKNSSARYAEWNYGPQNWMMNQVELRHESESKIYDNINLRFSYQIFGESRRERSLNDPKRYTSAERVDAYSANLDLVKQFNYKHRFFYGAEYILNQVHSTGKITNVLLGEDQTGPSRYPNADWQSVGFYIQDELEINKKWNLQGGLRYSRFFLHADFSDNLPFYPLPFEKAIIIDGGLTGSIGTVFRPSETWVLRSNFGTAFRAPNVDDIGKIFDSEPGAVTVPNPNLSAEYAYNIDFSIAKIFADRLKIDASIYYTILDKAMVRRNYTLNGQDSIVYEGVASQIQAIQNVAKANVYGIQAGVEWKLFSGFSFSSDINYQKGEEELDDGSTSPSRHASPLFGTSRIQYNAGNLQLLVYSQYQGTREYKNLAFEERSKDEIYANDENGNNYAPRWYTLNAKLVYQLKSSIIFSGGVENITDQRYRPYSSGISGPGINFIASLAYKFL